MFFSELSIAHQSCYMISCQRRVEVEKEHPNILQPFLSIIDEKDSHLIESKLCYKVFDIDVAYENAFRFLHSV